MGFEIVALRDLGCYGFEEHPIPWWLFYNFSQTFLRDALFLRKRYCALLVSDRPTESPPSFSPPLMTLGNESLSSIEVVALEMLSLVEKMKKIGIYRKLSWRKVKIQFFQLHSCIWKMLLSKATYNWADKLTVKGLPQILNQKSECFLVLCIFALSS